MPKRGTTNTPGEVLSSAAGGSAGGSFAEDGDQAEALERARLARDWMYVSDTSREVSATITLDGNRVDVSCIEVLLCQSADFCLSAIFVQLLFSCGVHTGEQLAG